MKIVAMIPTVHLNGTSKGELIAQLCGALNEIRSAQSALQRARPNGRDYYLQGPDAIRKAMDEHQSRYERLESVRKELEEIAIAIDGN